MLKNRIFQDQQLQERFEQDGYVIIPSNLSESQVQQLARFYLDRPVLDVSTAPHIAFSLLSKDKAFKQEASRLIMESMKNIEHNILYDYQLLIGSYATKHPNKQVFELHQNIPLVDEKQLTSLSLWMPLSDTSATNGTLQVIAGSHHTYRRARGYDNIFFNREEVLKNQELRTLFIAKGEVVIFDNSLLHCSDVNHSDELRIAVVTQAIPKNTTPVYHIFDHKMGKDIVLSYEINQAFFFDITNNLAKFSSQKPISMSFADQ